jgi:hypothetical protein
MWSRAPGGTSELVQAEALFFVASLATLIRVLFLSISSSQLDR